MTLQRAETAPDTGARLTMSEAVKSLTGFDEIAVEARFRREFVELGKTMTVRAVAFVLHRRGGMTDGDAYQAAMSAPLSALNDLFAPEPDDDAAGGEPSPEA